MISLKRFIIFNFLVFFLFSSCKKDIIETKRDIIETKKEPVSKKEISRVIPDKKKSKPAAVKKTQNKLPQQFLLPSWSNTTTKSKIIEFIKSITNKKSDDYIIPENRIAVFDNDGTIWAEYPTYFQVEFILYQIKEFAPQHPEWKNDDLIQTAIHHNLEKLRKKYGASGLGKLTSIAQAGMTTAQFEQSVQNWIKTAKHPISGKLFKEMIYQPMKEMVLLLQNNDFKVFIVAVGGVDFLRPLCSQLFKIPKENIIGSYQQLEYKKIDKEPVLLKSSKILFVNDGENKAIAIHQFIGQRPIIAFGNSDRDLQMLEWCAGNRCKNLPVIVHHTDEKREWAYDKNAHAGKLDKLLDEAISNAWLIVDMKKDWKNIYPNKHKKNITVNKIK
jgi:phosphoglycolate phosphatase-like HAD superfamily hydrolase